MTGSAAQDAFIILIAGFLGGTVNAVVGAGTLIVYPLLVAAGIPPIAANGTNTAGICVGSVGAVWGYRSALRDRLRILAVPLALTVVTAALGACLVIALPEQVFVTVVPWLILAAGSAVALAPIVQRRLPVGATIRRRPAALAAGVAAGGVYGGYFGAGQGIVYLALLGHFYDSDIQRANAAKNAIAAVANVTAAVVFALSGRVWWAAAATVAVGAFAGGVLGARLARRLPAGVLRAAVLVVAVVAAVGLWIT